MVISVISVVISVIPVISVNRLTPILIKIIKNLNINKFPNGIMRLTSVCQMHRCYVSKSIQANPLADTLC